MNTPEDFLCDSILDYPLALEKARDVRDKAWREYFAAKKKLDAFEAALKKESGNKEKHPELTNKSKREAWVEQRRQGDDYVELERAMADAKREANKADWRVKRLKDERDLLNMFVDKGLMFA